MTKALSFAESLLQQKKFHFQKRSGRLDLQNLKDIDVSNVVKTMDVDVLQRHLENLTYSQVCVDDFRVYSEDCLVNLFQIAQLTLEYLLNVQDTLAVNLNSLATKYANQKREMKVMQALIHEQKHTIDGLALGESHGDILYTDGKDLDKKESIKDERTQQVDMAEIEWRNDTRQILKRIGDDIVNENKRALEDAIRDIMKSFVAVKEDIVCDNKKHIEDERHQIMASLTQYFDRQQEEIILHALEVYSETKKEHCPSSLSAANDTVDNKCRQNNQKTSCCSNQINNTEETFLGQTASNGTGSSAKAVEGDRISEDGKSENFPVVAVTERISEGPPRTFSSEKNAGMLSMDLPSEHNNGFQLERINFVRAGTVETNNLEKAPYANEIRSGRMRFLAKVFGSCRKSRAP